MTPTWRKSSRSTTQGGECVEVAALSNAIGVRDSKSPGNGHITITAEQFGALVRRIKVTE